jgi:hypothetical protein
MERPAYEIAISDLGDRLDWALFRDEEKVAKGSVSLNDFNLDSAWSTAWLEANTERRNREVGG